MEQTRRSHLVALATGVVVAGCEDFQRSGSPNGGSGDGTAGTAESAVPTSNGATPSLQTSARHTEQTTSERTPESTPFEGRRPLTFTLDVSSPGNDGKLMQCRSIVLRGGTGHRIDRYDIGGDEDNLVFHSGASDVVEETEYTARWFTSPITAELPERSVSYDVDLFSGIDLTCKPAYENTTVTLSIFGRETDTVELEATEWQTVQLSFH